MILFSIIRRRQRIDSTVATIQLQRTEQFERTLGAELVEPVDCGSPHWLLPLNHRHDRLPDLLVLRGLLLRLDLIDSNALGGRMIGPEQQAQSLFDFDAQQTSLRVALLCLLEERNHQRFKPSSAELHCPQTRGAVEHEVEPPIDRRLDLTACAAVHLRESARRNASNSGLCDTLVSVIIAVHEAVLSGASARRLYHRATARG